MREYQQLDEVHINRRVAQIRILGLAVLLFVLLAGLVFRYYQLQIVQHEKFATLADENRVHVRALPPTRGLIFDRNGVVLAENRPSYTLSIVEERVEDLDELLDFLDGLMSFSDSEWQQFEEHSKQYRRPYESIPLRFQLTEEEVAVLAVNEFRLPGIEVEVELVRHYPFAEKIAHSLGYVGRINQREQAVIDTDRYQGTHVIGKVGIEKHYESVLLGRVGYEYVETDARGNVLRVLERQDAIAGQDIYLGIDSRMQLKAYELIKARRASVVALDVETGAVLTMVSTPSYDTNLFVAGISHRDYDQLLNHQGRPLYDRSLLGQYPPGSTVKPLFALAGLAEDVIQVDTVIHDHGEFQLEDGERIYRDWKRGGHGLVDVHIAIEQSCDIYFYELGHRAGIDVLHQYGDIFGLGKKTGIDMPSEMVGIMPSSRWKQDARNISWYTGDTINASIGQGFSLVTPIQLANMTANLARKGIAIRPHMVEAIGDEAFQPAVSQLIEVEEQYWQAIHSAMEDVVHDARGTAFEQGLDIDYRMAGKTGTAQVVSIAQEAEYNAEDLEITQRDHALFVSFAPAKNPKIAIAVIIENGEHGSTVAAPVARILTDKWFELYPHLLDDRAAMDHSGSEAI